KKQVTIEPSNIEDGKNNNYVDYYGYSGSSNKFSSLKDKDLPPLPNEIPLQLQNYNNNYVTSTIPLQSSSSSMEQPQSPVIYLELQQQQQQQQLLQQQQLKQQLQQQQQL